VAGESELSADGEDPHLIVRPVIRWSGQKGRFAQIGPPRKVGHPLRRQLVSVVDDSHGIAERQLVGETSTWVNRRMATAFQLPPFLLASVRTLILDQRGDAKAE
jgi:hypothetical protein